MARTTIGTARSMSTSSKTICGDLPPSSSTHLTAFFAAACCTSVPTSLEPVKEMKSMPGCADSAAPASSPLPVTMLSAPAGRPASAAISAKRSADRLVSSAGLSTAALPIASAGATVRPSICAG